MSYQAKKERYDQMEYRRCGKSGIKLPMLSLGLWHNFGDITPFETQRDILRAAFDAGITHFDLANNYGPPYGEAERNFGKHLAADFRPYRDELIISTKAGYDMWPGPYGNFGSRKYLIASLDQSLMRMGLDYVDIFYHHRPDPDTPLEETMGALHSIVASGKALYVGLSNYYDPTIAKKAMAILKDMGTPCLIHQPRYSLLDRRIESEMLALYEEEGVGCICYSPLEGGILTGKYADGIPADSRIGHDPRYLNAGHLTDRRQAAVAALGTLAKERGQSLSQMALSYVLSKKAVTSAVIGASRPSQLKENLGALKNTQFSAEEIAQIEEILK